MTFAVYLLCLYPDSFRKLRAEVMEKIGPTSMPTFDDVRTMKYLRAFINGKQDLIYCCLMLSHNMI